MEKFSADSPFFGLQIPSHEPLREVKSRHICEGCKKSTRYFCYRCIKLCPELPLESIPSVSLPLHLCIIKDKRELEGKSTSVHAKLIAPDDVSIINYDRSQGGIPYSNNNSTHEECQAKTERPSNCPIDWSRSVVLFPSADSKPVELIDWSQVKQLVLLDGTWQQAKAMCTACPVLAALPKVHLTTEHETAFWRYQHIGPHCLSTIEAIHQFYREYAKHQGTGQSPEHFDGLLYFFTFFYNVIQEDYRRKPDRMFTWKHSKSSAYIKYKDDGNEDGDDKEVCM